MTQRLNFSMAIVVALTVHCGPALAERKPERPSDANVIVWGTVEEIVRSETDENTNYEVRIRVESVERSYRAVVGKLFSVRCFQRKASAPRVPAASGHTAVPKVGQRIRAWVNRHKDGTNHGIYPDWFHIVELNEQQLTAFDWVKSKGGRLECDDSKPSRPIVSLDLYKIGGSGVRDQGLKHLAAFPELRKLDIGFSNPTAEGLREVAKLKHLENLTLCWARITDDDFRGLKGMISLTHLNATSTGITDRSLKQIATYTSLRTLRLNGGISDVGIEQLKPLKRLERLTLYQTRITDEGLIHLADFKSLRQLNLTNNEITDTGLKTLAGLSQLEDLNFEGCRNVTDAGLAHLAALKQLKEIDLQDTRVTDEGMKSLSSLPRLTEVQVLSTAITDKGLLHFTKCPSLRRIGITATRTTPEGIRQFKQAMPDCRVEHLDL